MADIKLSLVNQALSAVGEDVVTSLTGDSACTRAAIQHYDDIVAEELENNRPKFATKVANLTLLTARAAQPLQYRWQIPSDSLVILAPLYNASVIDAEGFTIEGDVVRTRYNSSISLRYIWSAPEEKWTSRFRRIVEQRLEALFLRVTERHNQADGRDANTDMKAARARHTDAVQQHSRPLGGGSIVAARQGLSRRRG